MRAWAPVGVLSLLVLTGFSGCFGGNASNWAYEITGLRTAQKNFDGKGIIVAIVDTGIDRNHSSLDHVNVIAWKDNIENRPAPYDDVGHGTHVAGILVGRGASFGGRVQGFDLRGAAPAADLVVVKAIGKDEKGPTTAVIQGMQFAIQHKADVICLSLGSRPSALNLFDNDMSAAIESASGQGILIVASAGNVREGEASQNDVSVPANQESVIAVGAIDSDRRVTDFSQRGNEGRNQGPIGGGLGGRSDPNKKPEVVAPGEGIKSAWINGNYATASGTSQAAPFVCGGLALLLQKCPALRAQNNLNMVRRVKTALMDTAEEIPGQRPPHDNGAGYGLFRADQLLDKFPAPC